jgi:hypothetical protein
MRNITINLVDHYNLNFQDEALGILFKEDKTLVRTKNDVVKDMGMSSKLTVFKISDVYIKVVEDNPFNFKIGDRLSPFELYCKFEHDGIFSSAYTQLQHRFGKELPYLRIGTTYFKKSIKEDANGINREELNIWKKDEIKQDEYKGILDDIKKYDGFCMRPSNTNFKRVHGGYYNKYHKFTHIPVKCIDEKEIPWSMNMVKHIWGDQWRLGLIWFQVKYLHPRQILPILSLVSKENQTGKTTFANWLVSMFGANAALIDVSSISGNFNESFAERNVVIFEETFSEKSSIVNRLKSISTQKTMSVNKKYQSEYDTDFYCTFVILSNHEEDFLKVVDEDIRYWIRKVPTLDKDNANHNIEKDLVKEIPKFIGFLAQLPPVDRSQSRMVFTAEQIRTNQLKRVKAQSQTAMFKDIKDYLLEAFNQNASVMELHFSHVDIKNVFFSRVNQTISYILKEIKTMGFEQNGKCARYNRMYMDNDMTVRIENTKSGNGNYWICKRDQFADWNIMPSSNGLAAAQELVDDFPF